MINLTIQSTIQSTIQNTIRNTLGDVSFDMLALFSGGQQGVWYDPSDLATLSQESTGVTPVTADGQPVGLMLDKSGNALNALQPVSTQRPTYNDNPDRLTLDLVDDSLAFTVPTGGIDGYMVVGTDEGTASYGVSLPAGDYDIGGDYFMGGSVNGFLLREGDVSASDLSNVEKDFVSKGAKASYGDVTDFTSYWRDKGITEFPLIDTSSGISFQAAWYINKLTSFPLIDTSNVTNFRAAWFGNKLTSFPLIDMSSGTDIRYAWNNNPNLTDFPANMFDNCLATEFDFAFSGTNLSQSSIDGILVSINSNGTSSGRFNQSGGSAPSATGEAAIDALRSRGWTITVTGGY